MFVHRLAVPSDMPALQRLMTAAIRELLPQFLTPEKVEASFAVMGVDSQLIEDGTYFILEEKDVIAGCGGWSRRATLFGHNHTAGRDSRLLDPAAEPARVRAMYTAPVFARRGVGRRILQLCEAAARPRALPAPNWAPRRAASRCTWPVAIPKSSGWRCRRRAG